MSSGSTTSLSWRARAGPPPLTPAPSTRSSAPPPLSPATAVQLTEFSPDAIEREQYEDFLRCRVFRRTLLCHAGTKPLGEPSPEAVMKLRVTGIVRPASERPDVASDAPEKFLAPKGASVTTNHPVIKAALVSLAGVCPRSVPFEALWEAVCA